MLTITRAEYEQKKEWVMRQIAQGALFIFPTDTIYRMGCDATNPKAVMRLRKLKKAQQPFAIIAPSKQWIRDHCQVSENVEETLDLLPGKYTLLLSLRNRQAIARETNQGLNTIGVRMPRSFTQEIASLLNKPIVTTAANVLGHSFMTSIDNIPSPLRKYVDFCIYDGEIKGDPISVLDLSQPIPLTRQV